MGTSYVNVIFHQQLPVTTSQCSDCKFERYFQYFVYGFNIRVVKQLSHISSILLKYFIIILVLEIVT